MRGPLVLVVSGGRPQGCGGDRRSHARLGTADHVVFVARIETGKGVRMEAIGRSAFHYL